MRYLPFVNKIQLGRLKSMHSGQGVQQRQYQQGTTLHGNVDALQQHSVRRSCPMPAHILMVLCLSIFLSACQTATYTHPYAAYKPEKIDTTIPLPITNATSHGSLIKLLRPQIAPFAHMGKLRIVIANNTAPNAIAVTAIQKALIALGIPNTCLFTTKKNTADTSYLKITGYRLTPPEEQGWEYPAHSLEVQNSPLLTGSSVNANIAKMVAIPQNAVTENPLGPADGERHAGIISSYRDNNATGTSQATNTGTDSSQSSGSSSSE